MRNNRIGIMGGGQLGMFLLQTSIQFPAHVSVYDPNPLCSAGYFTNNFQEGAFDDSSALIEFGKECDALIFETEQVNLEALKKLQEMGKQVWSAPESLEWIQDKGIQGEKLKQEGFPVPHFELLDAAKVKSYSGEFPIVQKWRRGGYDGQGVRVLKDASELKNADEVDSLFEEMVDIQMELSVIIARDKEGNIAVYPPIEMVFNQEGNLVDYLIAPARIEDSQRKELIEISQQMASQLEFRGIYAIEFFLDKNGKILVNEIAPRTHNSGHHTLSANVTSQYEQQIRLALGLPLGSTEMLSPCVMVNLLGEGPAGPTDYKGLKEAFTIPNVQYMFYGKSEVRPFRKMGHALILEPDIEKALKKIELIRNTLTISRHE